MSPDVDRLVVHLEAAEDAVQRGAPWMTVPRDDAILPEHLRTKQTFREVHYCYNHFNKSHILGICIGNHNTGVQFNILR